MTPDDFLGQLHANDESQYVLVMQLRELIHQQLAHAVEMIKYGGLYYEYEGKAACGTYPYTDHVSLVFSNGAYFNDPKQKLQGTGKFRRHLAFHNSGEIDSALVCAYLIQVPEYC